MTRRSVWIGGAALLLVVVTALYFGLSKDGIAPLRDLEPGNFTVRPLGEAEDSALILRRDGEHSHLLLFVHGWNGGPVETWGDLVPVLARAEDLPEGARWLSEFDVLTFGYETGPGADSSIPALARRLESVIDLEVRQRGYTSVHLLAHSMGGLVVQRYLVDELLEGDARKLEYLRGTIRSILYFDVPHNGLELADDGALRWLVRLERETADLRRGSEFRRELGDQWSALLADPDKGPVARQLLIDRAWILEADHTHERISVAGSQGIYGRFRSEDRVRRSTIRVVPDRNHTQVSKSTREELLAGSGVFYDYVAPVLGRSELVPAAGRRPFGLSTSSDGRWVYVVSSHWTDGGFIRRIDSRTRTVDPSWRAEVGANPHELAIVRLAGGSEIGVSSDNDRRDPASGCGAGGEPCGAGLTFIDLDTGTPLGRLELAGQPDALAVAGSLVAVTDGAPNGRVWVIDAETRRVVHTHSGIGGGLNRAVGLAGGGWQLTGATFAEPGRLLVAGHGGLGLSHGLLALLALEPSGELRGLDEVVTAPLVSDVDWLEGPGLVATSSYRESGGIHFHRLEGERLVATGGPGGDVPAPACFPGARLTDMWANPGGGTLFAIDQGGILRRLRWDAASTRFEVEEFAHGGQGSWGVTGAG